MASARFRYAFAPLLVAARARETDLRVRHAETAAALERDALDLHDLERLGAPAWRWRALAETRQRLATLRAELDIALRRRVQLERHRERRLERHRAAVEAEEEAELEEIGEMARA
jgi:hypothetical protein